MLNAQFPTVKTVLCLGAHADDIEIGAGGALLRLAGQYPGAAFHWIVFSANPTRRIEAEASARAFLSGAASRDIRVLDFRDGYFPAQSAAIKDQFEALKAEIQPDLIFSHYGHDLHQDHRLLAELTWNTWRNHLILEYEIPKYDGGLGSPNLFVRLTRAEGQRKLRHLTEHFTSQQGKPWFDEALFSGLMRLRGMECNAPDQWAEAFYVRKICCF